MNVLVVDDDEITQEMVCHVLTEAGYDVEVASDGHEAMGYLRTGDYRLIISDWVMPGMSGLELCRQIRRGDFPGYVYVILLTSRSRSQDVVEGLSAGADDFITKPFEWSELRVRVRAGERILSLETRDVAIFAMAKLAESRDPETGQHLERVRSHCRLIAQHLLDNGRYPDQVDPEFVRMIYLTSPLHDIGKVGVPDSILLKPGLLNEAEFKIMRAHATIGGETLDAALREYPNVTYLEMARDIAMSHHERYDGSGYPYGLSKQEIPLAGRIVALADVYDALTSKRVYKQAFTHAVARDILIEESGKHFDPVIVEAFLATEEGLLAIRSQFAETRMLTA